MSKIFSVIPSLVIALGLVFVEPGRAAEVEPASIELSSFGAKPYIPAKRFSEGVGLLVDQESAWTLALGALAVLGARQLDEEAQSYFLRERPIGGLNKLGNEFLGTGTAGAVLGAGFWLLGDLKNRPYEVHAGQAQIEALLATGLLTAGMKHAFGRERPDGSDRLSFPSAHTSYAFTTAAVLHEFYGWKVGTPAYLLGALTAASRLQDNRHWLSDTVGGATLAILVGRAFARAHLRRFDEFKSQQENKSQFTVLPSIENGGAKVTLRWTF